MIPVSILLPLALALLGIMLALLPSISTGAAEQDPTTLQNSLTQQLQAVRQQQEQLRHASSDEKQAEAQLQTLHTRQEHIEQALAQIQASLDALNDRKSRLQKEENALQQAQDHDALMAARLLPFILAQRHEAETFIPLQPVFWEALFSAMPWLQIPATTILTPQRILLARSLHQIQATFLQETALHHVTARRNLHQNLTLLIRQQAAHEKQQISTKSIRAHNRQLAAQALQTRQQAQKRVAKARQDMDALNRELHQRITQEQRTHRHLKKARVHALHHSYRKDEAIQITHTELPTTTGTGLRRGHGISPVQGKIAIHWDAPTEAGPATGLTYKATPDAAVLAPCTGHLLFSGTFRSFGQIVILDCGKSQRFVLTGFGKITVQTGQVVHQADIMGHMPVSGGLLFVQLHYGKHIVDPTPWLEASSSAGRKN